jgi:hypothetical protein
MLASIEIRPPSQFNPQGIDEPVIGVRLYLLPDVITPYLSPKDNRFGTILLCRLLQARMELAGVRVAKATGTLEFNLSYYLFAVSEIQPALVAVKAELEKLSLLPVAQIAWHDPREGVFRVWHSKSGRFDEPPSELEDAETRFLAALSNANKVLQQLEDEPAGQ